MSFRSKSTLICFIVLLYLIYTSVHRTRPPPPPPPPSPFYISTTPSNPIPNAVTSHTTRSVISVSSSTSSPVSSPTPLDIPSTISSSSISSPSTTTLIEAHVDPPIERKRIHDPNEKYLTFFTHSGFQNQLIQGKRDLTQGSYSD